MLSVRITYVYHYRSFSYVTQCVSAISVTRINRFHPLSSIKDHLHEIAVQCQISSMLDSVTDFADDFSNISLAEMASRC